MIKPYLYCTLLSSSQVERAQAREVYDELMIGDLTTTLRKTTPASLDLAMSGDVLVYFGDLGPFLRAAYVYNIILSSIYK